MQFPLSSMARRAAPQPIGYLMAKAVSGDFCYPEPDKAPSGKMRLSYGPTPAEDIEEGARRLAVSLAETPSRG